MPKRNRKPRSEKEKARSRERMKQWVKDNPERHKENQRRWKQQNKEHVLELARQQRARNLDRVRVQANNWIKKNKARAVHNTRLYQVRKIKAAPKWLSSEDIHSIGNMYIEAQRLTELTGIEFQIDHILPLRGKEVCGLHVPGNLQILPFYENQAKGNKLIC